MHELLSSGVWAGVRASLLEKAGLTNPVSEALVKEKAGPRDHRKPFYLHIHREPSLLAQWRKSHYRNTTI